MRSKSTIKIVETPIIDNHDFPPTDGVINPAFLDPQTKEEKSSSGQPLVNGDYRQTYFKTSTLTPGTSSLERRANGQIASGWVYNNGCSGSSTIMMESDPNSGPVSDMYRAPYGIRYNEHLSYEMDLSQEHTSRRKLATCWPTLVRIFVWSVIVISILGILASIGFIIYIERYAPDTCCADNSTNVAVSTARRNGSAVILQELPNGVDGSSFTRTSTTTAQPYMRSTTDMSPTTTTLPKVVTTTAEPKPSRRLPNDMTSDTPVSVRTTIDGHNRLPESTTKTAMTSSEESVQSITVSTASDSGLDDRQTTPGSSVSNQDQMINNKSRDTTMTSTAEPIITTELSSKSTVDNKSTEEVITATNGPIVTSGPALAVSPQTEGPRINQTGGQDTSTTATMTSAATNGQPETTTTTTTTTTTARPPITTPMSGGPGIPESEIRRLFGR